ncbi:FAD-dependent monooxygenase [Saccharopolyspora rosea]
MAGLFAARVLAEFHREVVLVDRDELTGAHEARRGVPQGRHSHALQARGLLIAEEMFPGIIQAMATDGAGIGDVTADVRWYVGGRPIRRVESGLTAVTASRPFLERHVRERVRGLGTVRFAERHNVLGLRTSPDRTRVTGVRVVPRDGEATEEVLDADLVVDATGRGSRLPGWLEELGYPRVAEQRLDIGLGYVTRHYRDRADLFGGDIAINDVASPDLPRGAALSRTEGGQIVVTGYGILGDHPPTDPEGFHAFLRTLSNPDVHQVVTRSEPLDDPVSYRFPSSLRRDYAGMSRFPEGLLVLGDAVSSFNPVYAQGMTVAALSALVLRRHLRGGGRVRPLRFFRDVSEEVTNATWDAMTVSDLRFPGVAGDRSLRTRLRQFYTGRVQVAATRDDVVARAYMRVLGLIDPADTLRRPGIVARVLGRALLG